MTNIPYDWVCTWPTCGHTFGRHARSLPTETFETLPCKVAGCECRWDNDSADRNYAPYIDDKTFVSPEEHIYRELVS